MDFLIGFGIGALVVAVIVVLLYISWAKDMWNSF